MLLIKAGRKKNNLFFRLCHLPHTISPCWVKCKEVSTSNFSNCWLLTLPKMLMIGLIVWSPQIWTCGESIINLSYQPDTVTTGIKTNNDPAAKTRQFASAWYTTLKSIKLLWFLGLWEKNISFLLFWTFDALSTNCYVILHSHTLKMS